MGTKEGESKSDLIQELAREYFAKKDALEYVKSAWYSLTDEAREQIIAIIKDRMVQGE